MCDIEIELPSIPVQRKYADVYSAIIRNANLRGKIKNVCPVLIKGAAGEAKTIDRGITP
jgi:hypothetical protein